MEKKIVVEVGECGKTRVFVNGDEIKGLHALTLEVEVGCRPNLNLVFAPPVGVGSEAFGDD